jgi:hypothetical protein
MPVREFAAQLWRIDAIIVLNLALWCPSSLPAGAPGLIVRRRDRDAPDTNLARSQRARDVRVHLQVEVQRPPRIKESAVFLTRESHELEVLPLVCFGQTQPSEEIVGCVFRVLRAHWRDLVLLRVRNPA